MKQQRKLIKAHRPLLLLVAGVLLPSSLLLLPVCHVQGFVTPTAPLTSVRTTSSSSSSSSPCIYNSSRNSIRRRKPSSSSFTPTTTTLFLSDIPEDETTAARRSSTTPTTTTTNNDKNTKSPRTTTTTRSTTKNNDDDDERLLLFQLLPPPPQDVFTMSGDLLTIALYGFMDHFVSQDVAGYLVQQHANHLDTVMVQQQQLPVWMSQTSSSSSSYSTNDMIVHRVVQTALTDECVTQYSTILQTTGVAVTLLASAWLLAGYFTQAFAFSNTLQGRTDHVLLRTAVTWMLTATILFGIIGWTNHFQYTTGDVYFIIDSFTELTLWRFLLSSMFGNNTRE